MKKIFTALAAAVTMGIAASSSITPAEASGYGYRGGHHNSGYSHGGYRYNHNYHHYRHNHNNWNGKHRSHYR